ncbi:helix-turn-helix domain-containing protein [Pseudenhygromyxa sp. WMMC2535]|uniref:AraC family transcriptional regulator n=1 Tax=Pseudenhygromyxa sp. WMMC2535 TaxID=2712867 RepID=UPI001551BDDA|nr:AraC family transcriptional regulator [Pseudenhygromyxa sp. WMMC2535]NVB41008.1 helix-turn-helix domain-containing protein [Pseudenhygromyxa sp. WMMC2535]
MSIHRKSHVLMAGGGGGTSAPGWSVSRRAYCSTFDLQSLLASVLREFGASCEAESVSLLLDERGDLHCQRCEDGTYLLVDTLELDGGARYLKRDTRETRMKITYAAQPMGELCVRWGWELDKKRSAERCRAFADDLGLLIQRHEVRRWSRETLGVTQTFIGLSPSLRAVEHQVERACETELPVVIRGEFGTEVLTAAVALHCGSSTSEGDFLILNCAALGPEDIAEKLERLAEAQATLFLCGVDELTPATQRALMSGLPALFGSPLTSGTANLRLIASTTQDLTHLYREGKFSPTLLTVLDVLEIVIPPLRSRSCDIVDIARHVLHEHHEAHSKRGAPLRSCSDELSTLLTAYTWPGNVLELERVILQLAVMSESNPLGLTDVERHAGKLLIEEADEDGDEDGEGDGDRRSAPPSFNDLDEWIAVMAERDYARFEGLHEGLQRALIYMCEHYQERVTLNILGKRAHLSNSHLSYLFKSSVGIKFKTLLARLRIEKAKRLLTHTGHPRRITDIASETGFGDLSHFEKTFRRFVNMCPREYRNSIAQ